MKLPLALLALLPLAALHAQTDAPADATFQTVPVTADGGGFTDATLDAGGTITASGGTLVITGGYSGASGSTITLGGSWLASGGVVNTYAGLATTDGGGLTDTTLGSGSLTTVSGGTLFVGGNYSGSSASTVTLSGGAVVNNYGIFNPLTVSPEATTVVGPGDLLAPVILVGTTAGNVVVSTGGALGPNVPVTLSGASTFGIVPVIIGGNAGTITLLGSGLIHTFPGLTFGGVGLGGFVIGTSTINANATLNLYSSQTLTALNIATGLEVTFGDGFAFAPASSDSSAVQAGDLIPEPGSAALLALGACALLGQRRRTA